MSLSDTQKLELVSRGLADPCWFCRTYFPEWFPLPMPWVHRGMLAVLTRQTDFLLNFGEEVWSGGKGEWTEEQLLKIVKHFVWHPEPDNPEGKAVPIFELEREPDGLIKAVHMFTSSRTLLILPRGISKTTLVNACNIRDIVHQRVDFLVYLAETATHSETQVSNVRRELESNAGLIAVYGNLRPLKQDSEKWTDGLIETTTHVVVAAKGRGGQVRGMNHNGKRPSRIVFDDVEDKESVKTDEQRAKAMTWLMADVVPALPQIGEDRGELIGVGTIIHHDSMLVNLSKDPEWLTVKFGAVDPEGEMLWEHYMDKETYARRRRSFIKQGKLADFNMEYNSSTKADAEQAKFPLPYQYLHRERTEFAGVALAVDPAISEDSKADYCSFGVVGMTEKGKLHVLDFHAEIGMHPRAQIDKYFELYIKWLPNYAGVEAIAYQKALVHLLKEEMFRKGKLFGSKVYHQISEIKHGKTGKVPRVEGVLATRFAAGYVSFERRFPILEEQLLDWPNGKLDGPDVIAMAVTLLDPYAAFALEEEEDGSDKISKDQYEPLDLELGEWRSAP